MTSRSHYPHDSRSILNRSRELEVEFRRTKRTKGQTGELILRAERLLADTAESGMITPEREEREVLRSVGEYWASVLRVATEEIIFAPALVRFAGRPSRRNRLRQISRDELQDRIRREDLVTGVALEGVDLSGIIFGNARIIDSVLRECNLDGATFGYGSQLIYTNFTGSSLKRLRARGMKANGAIFTNALLEGADFGEADLSWALLTGAKFDRETNFSQSTFTSANLRDVKGDGSLFNGAIMPQVELQGATLTNCDFRSAFLIDGKLQQADLSGANLHGAFLQSADIYQTNFVGANLGEVNFERAKNVERALFDQTNWQDARFDSLVRAFLEGRVWDPIDISTQVDMILRDKRQE